MIYCNGVSDVDIVWCVWLMCYVFVFDSCLLSKLPNGDMKVF